MDQPSSHANTWPLFLDRFLCVPFFVADISLGSGSTGVAPSPKPILGRGGWSWPCRNLAWGAQADWLSPARQPPPNIQCGSQADMEPEGGQLTWMLLFWAWSGLSVVAPSLRRHRQWAAGPDKVSANGSLPDKAHCSHEPRRTWRMHITRGQSPWGLSLST